MFWIFAGFSSKIFVSTKSHEIFLSKMAGIQVQAKVIEISDGKVLIETAISELKIAKTQTFWSPVYMYLGKLHIS